MLHSKISACVPVYAPQCKFLDNYLGLGLLVCKILPHSFLYLWEDFLFVQTTRVCHFHRVIIVLFQVPLRTINSWTGSMMGWKGTHKMSICIHHNRPLHWIDLGLCMCLSLKLFVKSWASSNQQIECPHCQQIFSNSRLEQHLYAAASKCLVASYWWHSDIIHEDYGMSWACDQGVVMLKITGLLCTDVHVANSFHQKWFGNSLHGASPQTLVTSIR